MYYEQIKIALEKLLEKKELKNGKHTAEMQLVLNLNLSMTKNRKVKELLSFLFPFPVCNEQKVVVFSTDPTIEQRLGVIADRKTILNDLQTKKLSFDILITDNLSISGIAPYAKKLSTQGKMPKEDLFTLSKAGSSKDMISKYEEFKNGLRKILVLKISDKNSILYTSIGSSNDIESASKNADFLLSELIDVLGNNPNLVLKKKINFREIYVKFTRSQSISIGIKK